MRIAVSILVLIHGLYHCLRFMRSFAIANTAEFTNDSSKSMGLLWLVTGLLFIVTAMMIFLKKEVWALLIPIAVTVSQILIVTFWSDAKYLTVVNIIILAVAVIGWASIKFENSYKKEVLTALQPTTMGSDIITENDLEPLPILVQKYLRYAGVVGKPKVNNMKIVFSGAMRDRGKAWFDFTSEQYNFFGLPTRLFFMKARIKGMPTNGYHKYNEEGASMRIKFLSLFSVVAIDDPQLFPTETVTFFNDLCLFAPAALIDERIIWEPIDARSVKATFTTKGIRIAASLYFNEKGQLVNFISNDRYSINEMKAFPFSTPVSEYRNLNGYNLATYGEATWHYPEGEFVYGKFNLKSVAYNVTEME